VPPGVPPALQAVRALQKGRSEARETDPVEPVPEGLVEAIQPFVARQVWAMVELQRLTGMRPGEVILMRTCDLDTSERVWVYTPSRHKSEDRGRSRLIDLGPRAQEVLRPWPRPNLTEYLFSPREVMDELVFLDAVGADRIPDPTTAGDVCRDCHTKLIARIFTSSFEGSVMLLTVWPGLKVRL
jgi:integrase